MQVTFLGTGTSQGVPVIACDCDVCKSLDFRDKRLRTSVHIEVDGLSLVIDTGTDFRQQVLSNHITKLDAVSIPMSTKIIQEEWMKFVLLIGLRKKTCLCMHVVK